jgi:hypothetical protein
MVRCMFRGEMGVIERLAECWEHVPFAVAAALVGLCASLVSCPLDSVKSVSNPGVKIRAATPLLRPNRDLVEDGEREFQEDDLEPCGLPGVTVASSAPSLALSQITPPQSVYLSLLTVAQRPLLC